MHPYHRTSHTWRLYMTIEYCPWFASLYLVVDIHWCCCFVCLVLSNTSLYHHRRRCLFGWIYRFSIVLSLLHPIKSPRHVSYCPTTQYYLTFSCHIYQLPLIPTHASQIWPRPITHPSQIWPRPVKSTRGVLAPPTAETLPPGEGRGGRGVGSAGREASGWGSDGACDWMVYVQMEETMEYMFIVHGWHGKVREGGGRMGMLEMVVLGLYWLCSG